MISQSPGKPSPGWIASQTLMKKRRLLILLIVLLVAGAIAWRTVFVHHSTSRSMSPDSQYTATVRSAFALLRADEYDIEVRRSDGALISHLTVHDKVSGWGRDPSITWTPDSKTVTLGIQDGDTDGGPPIARKRVSIDVK
jgi:hypothetical protein